MPAVYAVVVPAHAGLELNSRCFIRKSQLHPIISPIEPFFCPSTRLAQSVAQVLFHVISRLSCHSPLLDFACISRVVGLEAFVTSVSCSFPFGESLFNRGFRFSRIRELIGAFLLEHGLPAFSGIQHTVWLTHTSGRCAHAHKASR